ncbi:Spore germination B3/ GerAC like, C-terminal [Melghirimyces algeriensis]|uniref:Spore germination B3/ GerAC like, C-terminal n=1 Tax=Melghirimyces algeriensis TaxID=910412 RepID=A0A521AIW8_9BACL|nr:Spore germination B3/ GerAC like, C-terminal [Melghirimyces algeriensis]
MFNIDVNVEVVVTERLFPFDLNKHPERMESLLEHRLKKENEALVEKLQKHQVDPLGLGVYAREYPYDAWNKEQDDWGKALSRARITVSPQVEIRNFGVTM